MHIMEAAFLKNWSDFDKETLIAYLSEIKRNKVLDIKWQNPGRIEPSLYQAYLDANNQKCNEAELNNESNVVCNDSPNAIDNKDFDMFEDFNEAEAEHEDEIFSLKLTHRKRSTEKKIASMDKILDDMRRVKSIAQDTTDSEAVETDPTKVGHEFQMEVVETVTSEVTSSDLNAVVSESGQVKVSEGDESIDSIVQALMLEILDTYFSLNK